MKTLLTQVILTIFILGITTELVNARSYFDNKPKTKSKCNTKTINKIDDISTLNNTMEFAAWNYIEFESELPVTCLEEINITERISWLFPEYEKELDVPDYKDTKDIIPYWMIIEQEAELEVLDLVIK